MESATACEAQKQKTRASLRKDFLKVIANLEGKTVSDIKLFGDTSAAHLEDVTKVLAVNRELLHVLVAPLITPTGARMDTALLRGTDIASISIPLQNL
jgi:hypothetical protein